MSSNDNDAVMTISELMKRWKYSRKTILEAIHSGKLHAFRLGERSYRVAMSEVTRYERAQAA